MTSRLMPKLAVLFAVMFVIVIVSSKLFSGARLDLTESGLYTLSDGTKSILSELDQTVTLQFYFSDKATAQIPQLRGYAQRVEELLQEYVSLSDGKILFEKIDPEPFSEEEDEAALSGLQGVPSSINGDEIYFGLVARNEQGAEEVIPFMQPDRETFLEYELTKLVSSLSKNALPKVGIYSSIEINGGFDYITRQPRQEWAVIQFIQETFEIEWIESKATKIEGIDVLLLIGPQDLSQELQFAIDQFVLSGGRTVVFLDPFSEALSGKSQLPSVQRSDLESLLPGWGVSLREGEFVKDYQNSMVVGVGPERTPVRHLGLLSITPDGMKTDDIVLFGLESLNWSTAGIIDKVDGAATTIVPLVQTSSEAQPHDVNALLDMQDPQILFDDFAPTGEQYTLAARVSGPAKTAFPDGIEIEIEKDDSADVETSDSGEQKEPETESLMPEFKESDNIQLLVISDTDVLSDRLWVQVQNFFGQQIVTPWADNGSLLLNGLENMSGHPGLIEIRSQGRFNRPFTLVEDIRLDAEARFLAEQEVLESELASLETKLVELEQLRAEGDGAVFTPEQEAELLKFQEEKLKIRKKLRDVQHQLTQDIESLGLKLKLINIALVPGIICFLVLLFGLRKRAS